MAVGAPAMASQPGSPSPGKSEEAGEKKPAFGSSPATQATPNAGYDAAAVQGLGVVINMMQRLLLQAGATSEIGKVILKSMNDLVKAVPAGTVTPAAEKNMLGQAQMQNTQNSAIQQQLRARAVAQGAGGAPGGGAPAGGPPSMGAAA